MADSTDNPDCVYQRDIEEDVYSSVEKMVSFLVSKGWVLDNRSGKGGVAIGDPKNLEIDYKYEYKCYASIDEAENLKNGDEVQIIFTKFPKLKKTDRDHYVCLSFYLSGEGVYEMCSLFLDANFHPTYPSMDGLVSHESFFELYDLTKDIFAYMNFDSMQYGWNFKNWCAYDYYTPEILPYEKCLLYYTKEGPQKFLNYLEERRPPNKEDKSHSDEGVYQKVIDKPFSEVWTVK